MKYINKLTALITAYCFITLLCAFFSPIFAQKINEAAPHIEQNNYSFLILGHLYGRGDAKNTFPAATVLGNLKFLQNKQADFIILLGDIIAASNNNELINLQNSFLNYFKIPIFNAPGNHERLDGTAYFANYPTAFTSFNIGNDLFLILDTGQNGEINVDQKIFLTETLSEKKLNKYQRIFIFSHRLFWLDQHPKLIPIQTLTNNQKYTPEDQQLSKLISTLLKNYQNNVYYFAGDVGVNDALNLLNFSNGQLHYLASGVGDEQTDVVVEVKILPDEVLINAYQLSNQQNLDLTKFEPDSWLADRQTITQKTVFINKLLALIKKKSFWAGIILGAISIGFTLILLKKFIIKKQ